MATTPNMNLTIPDVSVTSGPTYATQINEAITDIDAHDHTSGNGKLIPSSGLGINADVEFNNNGATEIKRITFQTQTSVAQVNSAYMKTDGDFYIKDGSGNEIRLTSGGAINVASAGGFGGDYVSAGASAIYTNSSSKYTFRTPAAADADMQFKGMIASGAFKLPTTALAGNLTMTDSDGNLIILVDTSSGRTVTLPDPTLGKRLVIIKDSTGQSETNNITLTRFGAETIDGIAASKALASNFGTWWLVSNLTNWFFVNSKNQTSVTYFDGPGAAGSDALTMNAWTSFTLSAAAFVKGIEFNRSTNDLTAPFIDKFQVRVDIPSLDISGSTPLFALRLRNTTDSTTSDVAVPNLSASFPDRSSSYSLRVNVTDTAKVYQVQYYASAGGGSPSGSITNATVGGETPVRWRICISNFGSF